MVVPTSSSNRSKRKTNKPVTQGQNPQRANRQKVSKANVTNSSNRGQNTGSAKVTTGKGGSGAPKALPPGRKGGPLTTQGRGNLGGQRSLPPGRKGGQLEKAGPTIDVKANTSKLPTSKGGPLAKGSSSALSRAGRTAASVAKAGSKLGRLARGASVIGGAVTAGEMLGSALVEGRKALQRRQDAARPKAKPQMTAEQMRGAVRLGQAQPSDVGNKKSGSAGRSTPTPQSQQSKPRQTAPQAPRSSSSAPTYRPAGTQPSTRSSSPRPSTPTAPKERRVSAATANREAGNYGTSRTNNPLMKDMTERMRQRENREGVGPMRDGARYAADVKNTTQGVGPLKDGPTYGSNLQKAIDDMKRRKKERDAANKSAKK